MRYGEPLCKAMLAHYIWPPRLYHLSKNKYAQFLSVKLPSMCETNVCERYRHVLLEYYISFCLAALHAIDTVIGVFLFRFEPSFVPILIYLFFISVSCLKSCPYFLFIFIFICRLV